MESTLTDDEIIELTKHIAPSYYQALGVKLGIPLAQLDQILQSNFYQYPKSIIAILTKWRDQQCNDPSIRTRLVEKLSLTGLKMLEGIISREPSVSRRKAEDPTVATPVMNVASPPCGLGDDILAAIATNLESDDQLESLARALGVSRPEIQRCHTANRLSGSVTTHGTNDLLFRWRGTVAPHNQMGAMRNAMTSARLLHLRDTVLREAELRQLQQQRIHQVTQQGPVHHQASGDVCGQGTRQTGPQAAHQPTSSQSSGQGVPNAESQELKPVPVSDVHPSNSPCISIDQHRVHTAGDCPDTNIGSAQPVGSAIMPSVPHQDSTAPLPLTSLSAEQLASYIGQGIPKLGTIPPGANITFLMGNFFINNAGESTSNIPSVKPQPSIVPHQLIYELSVLLNQESVLNNNWIGLAIKLDLDGYIEPLKLTKNPTEELIKVAEYERRITKLEDLMERCEKLKRHDCVDIIKRFTKNSPAEEGGSGNTEPNDEILSSDESDE